MSDVLKIGVIGWGCRGRRLGQEMAEATAGKMQAVACVEPDDAAWKLALTECPVRPERYTTVTQMMNSEKLDGLLIASSNYVHLQNLLELGDVALPMLLEKPLDSTLESIFEVVRFCEKYSAPVMVGHCMRYAPVITAAENMLRRGDIGNICSVRFVQNCHYGNNMFHNWRQLRKYSGTMLLEKATHDFDVMLALVGDVPDAVAAIQKLQAYGGDKSPELRCSKCPEMLTCQESQFNRGDRLGRPELGLENMQRVDNDLCVYNLAVDSPDNDHCLINFKGGAFGTYVQWFFSPPNYHHRVYEIHGTEGAMEIDLGTGMGKIKVSPRFGCGYDDTNHQFDYIGRNHYNGDGVMLRHFMQIIKGEAEPKTTVAQAFASEMLGYAAIQSAESRRFIDPASIVPDDLKQAYNSNPYRLE